MVISFIYLYYTSAQLEVWCAVAVAKTVHVLWLYVPSIVIPGTVLLSMSGFPGRVSKLS